MIFSQKKILTIIHPILLALIFIISLIFLNIIITPFLGLGEDYRKLLIDDGVFNFILNRFIVLATVTSLSFILLYISGKLCKKTTNKMTYLILFLILFAMAAWRTYSFIDSYLWNYSGNEII